MAQHPLVVVPYYAVALAALFMVLSARVILARRAKRIGFGAGGQADLERLIRVHGNFAEYVPLALLLLTMAELNGAQAAWVHAGCILLVAGRLAHAFGLARPSTDELGRILGMTGSQSAILLGAILLALNR